MAYFFHNGNGKDSTAKEYFEGDTLVEMTHRVAAYLPSSTKIELVEIAQNQWIVLKLCKYFEGPSVHGYLALD